MLLLIAPLALFSFLKKDFRCGDVDVSAPKRKQFLKKTSITSSKKFSAFHFPFPIFFAFGKNHTSQVLQSTS